MVSKSGDETGQNRSGEALQVEWNPGFPLRELTPDVEEGSGTQARVEAEQGPQTRRNHQRDQDVTHPVAGKRADHDAP